MKSEKKNLITRCSKIEGMMRGIAKMIENNRPCEDIVIQLLAINNSIKSLSNELIKDEYKEIKDVNKIISIVNKVK